MTEQEEQKRLFDAYAQAILTGMYSNPEMIIDETFETNHTIVRTALNSATQALRMRNHLFASGIIQRATKT